MFCAAGSCTERVKPGYLMCRTHWFLVPASIRQWVWRTWRALQNDMGDEQKESAYEAARDAAIQAVGA